MKLENPTGLPAALVRSSEADDRVTALLVAAATYRIDGERLTPAPSQRPLELDGRGPVPTDAVLVKQCVSVCVTGFVYADGARRASARLRAGALDVSVAAFGPRVWREGVLPGTLTATDPLPFERVAMTWKNAYGGSLRRRAAVLKVDGEDALLPAHEAVYPWNPEGTGYYLDRAEAVDQPLPQLEHPEQLVARWDDRPEPSSLAPYPLWGGLRASTVLRGKEVDLTHVGRLPSRAAPRTTLDRLEPGARVIVEGMRPRGQALAFTLPAAPVALLVSVGGEEERFVPAVDAVDVDAEAAEVRVLFRAAFSYPIVRGERRRAVLVTSA